MKNDKNIDALNQKIKILQKNLSEAKAIIGAIKSGTVDAFVMSHPHKSNKIYTLKDVNYPYRGLVESMYEGAVSFIRDGTIIYSNNQFAKFIKLPMSRVIGHTIYEYFPESQHPLLLSFIKNKKITKFRNEFTLGKNNKFDMIVYFSATKLMLENKQVISLVVTDLTELKNKEIELIKLNANLTLANKSKSYFLANMSHELRTPLQTVIGFAELMYKGKVGPVNPEHMDYLDEITRSAHHLLYLINQILDLSKIESGKMELHLERCNLAQLIQEVHHAMSLLIVKDDIIFETFIDPLLADDIIADAGKVKEILFNFLSNAFKYTPAGGKVTVRIMPESKKFYRLEVSDTGIGISKHDIDKIFVMFGQLNISYSKPFQGIGLGLALTRHIAEALGGTVGVVSEPGKGSTFFAILPWRPATQVKEARKGVALGEDHDL